MSAVLPHRARVLCTLPLPEPGAGMLAAAADVEVVGRIPSPAELCERLAAGVDVLCAQLRDRVDEPVLAAGAPRLRAVSLYSVGYENVDIDAATRHGVLVYNTPGVLTDATADLALGLILAAARRIAEGDAMVRAGSFTGWAPDAMLGLDLTGARLAIVGLGRIGQALARRALACQMEVVAVLSSANATVPDDLRGVVAAVDLDTAVRTADVLSLHVPLTPRTRHLVDAGVLRRMRPSAILVNTARGAIVDEGALVTALRDGWIAGAGLDVYEHEPHLAAGLASCRTAVLSPHIGSATTATRARMAEMCAANALAALTPEGVQRALNPAAARAQA